MIKRLLYLNGLAVLTVILYHSSAWGFIAMFFWTDQYRPVGVPNFEQLGSVSYYGLRAIEQLVIYGIPAFLFVSGFFIAISTRRVEGTISWKLIFRRIKNLVIPFLIWSLVILALEIAQGARFSVLEFVRTIVLGQTTDAYYFVPVLVQMYLLSPFLVPLARKNWKLLLLAAAAIQIAVMLLHYTQILGLEALSGPLTILTRSWFFPGFIFWFVLGMVVGFHLDDFKARLYQLRWFFIAGLILFFIVGMIEWELLLRASGQAWIGPRETLIDNFYALFFLLSFLAFSNANLPLPGRMSELGTKSYGIYLVHSPVLEYTARIIYNFVPFVLAYQILFQPILYAAGLGIPLLLMAIVNRSTFRRYYSYLFG